MLCGCDVEFSHSGERCSIQSWIRERHDRSTGNPGREALSRTEACRCPHAPASPPACERKRDRTKQMKPELRTASHTPSMPRIVVPGTTKPLHLDCAFWGVSGSTQWIRKAGFTLSKLCAVSARDLPTKNRTIGWPRPTNGRGSDNLANNGRLAQANHQDLRKKENEPLSALPRAATAESTL